MLLFISSQKLFSFLRYLNFCRNFFGHVGNCLDKKAKLNFKIYDVTNLKTNNYNAHIVKYLKKERQSNNEIWSVNRI